MRKIKSFPRYLKYQKQKQTRALDIARKKNGNKQARRYISELRRKVYETGYGYIPIDAPNNFSFVNNPDEMILFLENLNKIIFKGKSVIINLANIKDVTNDALIALLSVIQDKKVPRSVKVFVQEPNDNELADRLRESGISEQSEGLESVTPPKYGRFRQKNSFEADTEKANELIQFATRQIFGQKRRLFDVQRILSECVDNTTSHASPNKKLAEMWWGTVFCNTKKKIAYFSILDNGIGVIDSLKIEWFKELKFLLKYKNNALLMQDVFQGGVLSRTSQNNRGNGLPGIYKARERKEFVRLIVITNNVYIDFDNGIYRLLDNSFSGTFFYWEVRNENDGSNRKPSN